MPACYYCNDYELVHKCFMCTKYVCEKCGVYRDFKWFCKGCG